MKYVTALPDFEDSHYNILKKLVPHPFFFTVKQLAIQNDILVTGYGKICLGFHTMQYIKFAPIFHRNVPPPYLA